MSAAPPQDFTSKYYDGLPQELETSSVDFTPEMAQKSLADYFERTDTQFKMLGEQFNLGAEDVKDSYMLLRSAYDPDTNPDEELKLLDAMNTRKPEVQAYRQRLEKEQGFLPWTEKVFSDTARMLPSTFTTIEHGLATGAPAAVAGGAVAYPAGPIPALTTALSWGALGSRAGAAEAAFTISFGEVYKDALTKTDANGQRMPRETARQTAFAAAGVMAILEMAELKILGQAGKKGAAAILKTPGMQKLIYNDMLKRAKDMGYDIIKEVGVEGAQEMAKQMSFMAAGLYEKRDAQAYVKFAGAPDAAVNQVGSAIINAIGPSALMIGGSSAIGSAGGAAAKAAGIGADKEGQITYKGAPIIDQLKKVNAQLDAEAELPGGVEVESLTIAEDGKVVAKKAQAGLVMNEEGQFVLQGGIAVDDTAPVADMAPAAETISNATGLPTDLVQEGLKALDTALTQTTGNTQAVTAEEIAQAGLDALFPAEQAPQQEAQPTAPEQITGGIRMSDGAPVWGVSAEDFQKEFENVAPFSISGMEYPYPSHNDAKLNEAFVGLLAQEGVTRKQFSEDYENMLKEKGISFVPKTVEQHSAENNMVFYKEVIEHYVQKYKIPFPVEIDTSTYTSNNDVQTEYDKTTGDVKSLRISVNPNSPPLVLRHEIEHLLDVARTGMEGYLKRASMENAQNAVGGGGRGAHFDNYSVDFAAEYMHRKIVKEAVLAGENVPDVALAHYPDLKQMRDEIQQGKAAKQARIEVTQEAPQQEAQQADIYHTTITLAALEEGVLRKAGSQGILNITPDSDPRAVYFSSNPEWNGRSLSDAKLVFDKDTLGLPEGPRHEQEQEFISSEDVPISKENGLKKIILYPSGLEVDDVVTAGLEQDDPRFDGSMETSMRIAKDIVRDIERRELERVQKAAVKYADKYGVPVEIASRASGKAVVQEVVEPPKTSQEAQPTAPEQIRVLPNTLDDVEVRPLAPIEIEARQNQIASDLRMVGAEVRKLEREYDKRFVANERAAQLKEEIATLQQEQKGNAEQIKQLNSDLKRKIKAGKPDANITKTLDMFGERQQAVVDQLTTKQLELNNIQQKPMARVEEARDKMYEVYDTLKFEQDLLREGLMDAQDVRGAQGKLKIQKVANLIDRLNASVQRSAKKAKTATLREVRAAQAALKKLITEAGLTKENQAKLLKKINTVTSMGKLATVLPEVQSQVLTLQEQQLAEAMTAKVEKLLEQAKLKKGSKYPKGKFSPETQKTLNLFKQFIKDPAAREAAINARFEKAFSEDPDVQNTITQDEYLASDIALSLAGFESFDSAQLEAVAQTIADTIELGRSESQMAAEKRKAETDAVVEVAKETFDKGPPIRRDRLGGVERFKQNLGRWYNRALKGDSSWASLMNLLSEYDPDHKLTEALSDIAPTRLQDKGRSESIQGLSTVIDGVLQANKIQGDLYTFAQETANDGNTVYEVEGLGTLEKGDIMRLYANFYCAVTEPNVRSAMENAGISFYDNFGENSTEASVEGHLRAVEKEAVIATVQYLTTSTYARYNEVFRQENNVDLPKAQRYFPLEIAGYEGKVGDMLAEKTMTRGVTPGSAYSRTKHNKPIEIKGDFWATVGRHLDEVEHYRSHVKFVRHLNAVFKNGEVRDAVKNRYGPEIQSLVNNFIERFTQNSRYSATAKTSGVDWLRGNLTKAYLGANILQIPKVMTSMNLITMNLTPAQWAVGAKGLAQNWEATMTALFNEPSIKERYRNANEDIRAAQSSAPFAAFRKVPDISSMLMTAFRIGDSGSVMFAGGTLYNAELARGRTHEQALNEVVRMVQQTQGASTVAETTPQRAASDIGRLVSMFTQQLNQQLQHEEQAVRDIVRALQNPDITPAKRKEVVGRGLRQLLNLRASIGLFTAVSSATSLLFLPSDRDDEPERLAKEAGRIALAMAIGPVGGLMYIGPVIEFAMQAIAAYSMGEKGPRMPRGLPIWDTVENVGKFLKLSMDIAIPSEDDGWMSVEEVDEENKKWVKAAARVTAQVTGLPVGRVVDSVIMAQELTDSGDPAGAVLAGLGANTGDLKRRAVNEDDEEPQPSPAEWLVQSANDALEVVKMQNAEDDEAEGDVLDLETLNALEAPPVDDNPPENDIVDTNLTPNVTPSETPQQYEDLAP